MRGGTLKRFVVYTPPHHPVPQKGGSLYRWGCPPPFVGTWSGTHHQMGSGMKEMAQDFLREVRTGIKSGVKKRSLSEVKRGVKRGAKTALKNKVKRKVAKKIKDIFGE